MNSKSGIRLAQIGLDRTIRLKWLEQTASLVLAGNDISSIKANLEHDLSSSFRSDASNARSSIDKSITILIKVWLRVPSGLESFRTNGLEILKKYPLSDHKAIHWGMIMVAYPFWADVALQVGRLIKLQGSVVVAQVQRRLREQYGERETVSRAVQRVLRSFHDWRVLNETGTKGIYNAAPSLAVEDTRLIAWLVEASLYARANGSAPLKDLLDSPILFPFRLRPIHPESLMAASSRLDILHHGLDDDLVMLRKQASKEVVQ